MEDLHGKIASAQELMPVWFVPRMMSEQWIYGLMMSYGQLIAIEIINDITRAADGSIWIEVTLAPADDYWGTNYDPSVFGAPTTRRKASINVAHIAAALDLIDTPPKPHSHPID